MATVTSIVNGYISDYIYMYICHPSPPSHESKLLTQASAARICSKLFIALPEDYRAPARKYAIHVRKSSPTNVLP